VSEALAKRRFRPKDVPNVNDRLQSRAPGRAASRAFALFGIAAAALSTGCAGGKDAAATASENATAAVPVSVVRLRTASFSTPTELSGSLVAVRSVTVGAVSAGRIVSVAVQAGDRVRAGQVLAQVDTAGYGAGLAQAKAGASASLAGQAASRSALQAASSSIEGARAQLGAARSRYELARTTAGRMATLFAEGAISRQQNDEAQANLAAAQAGVAQAQAGLNGAQSGYQAALAQSHAASDMAAQARAGVAAADVPLREATLTAPFAGIVTAKFVEPGAVVGPGSPVVTVQNTHDLELDVAVPDQDVAGLVPGTPANVRVDAIGGKSVPARIRAIVPSQNPALRSATVKIALSDRADLLPGMFARVVLPSAAHQGWAVPLAALVTRAGQPGIFVVREGTASFVPVQSGTVGDKLVEVRGIEGGDVRVAVTNLQRLTEGAAVTVTR
jgi:multidrug resistance efflux pump